MPAAPPGRTGHSLLVCIYYRVAADDTERAIRAVREFQRTLPADMGLDDPQVLLRCGLPNADAVPEPVSARSSDLSSALPPAPAADATLMETYRLALPAPAGSPAADAAARVSLAALDTAAASVADLLLGSRHVEFFAPCVS